MKNKLLCYALIALIPSPVFAQQNVLKEESNLVREEPMSQSSADVASSEPATPIAQGMRYACTKDGVVRRVEIEYEAVNAILPCSVNYYKDHEAPGQNVTLWRAEKSEGFCESKTSEFVNKLKKIGWDCTES